MTAKQDLLKHMRLEHPRLRHPLLKQQTLTQLQTAHERDHLREVGHTHEVPS